MRALNRNKQEFSYCKLTAASAMVVDENDNATGERVPVYSSAVSMTANISPAKGYAAEEMFGKTDDYDKVIVTDDLNCPIAENDVLFIDKAVAYRTESIKVLVPPANAQVSESYVTQNYTFPLYDYIVKRVSKSLNSVAIAVTKVKVD